ncbi:MAG: hypothetical protein ACLUML_02005 [Acutalibacteraceae bacterium]
MNTEKAIREAIRDHFSVVSDTDAAITEEALSGLDRIRGKNRRRPCSENPMGFIAAAAMPLSTVHDKPQSLSKIRLRFFHAQV